VNELFRGHAEELVLGPYLVLERLGSGGTGQVFKARHRRMERIVALKLIRQELLADPEVLARFYREIRLVSQLSHPHIVHAYDAGPVPLVERLRSAGGPAAPTGHMLVMEYVQGIDLDRLVKRSGPLSAAQACEFIRQAAVGLQYAHERGLVHRDIKPPNLLIADCGLRIADSSAKSSIRNPPSARVKILDLGLARLPRRQQSAAAHEDEFATSLLTPVGSVMMGTPDFMAPEQAIDFHQVDIRADIYSLGCTFFFLLTGRPPFPGGSAFQKLMRHQQAPPPDVTTLRADLPAGLNAVLQRMLAKTPQDRYQTPAAVATALAPFAAGDARASRPSKLRGRRWFLVPVLGGATALLFLGIFLFRRSTPPARTVVAASDRARTPLETLDAAGIPASERFAWQPKELMAVLGEHRWHQWDVPTCVSFSPGGRRVASGGRDRAIRIWDASTGIEQGAFRHILPVAALAFSPDSGKVVSAAHSGPAVHLWDLATGKELPRLWRAYSFSAVAFSPDGQTVAAAGTLSGKATIILWDAASGKEQASAPATDGSVCLFFTRSGRELISSGRDGIRLWDVNPLQERAVLKRTDGDPTNNNSLPCLALGRDETTLAAGYADGVVVFWDTRQRRELGRLSAHKSWVRSIAFSPDGQILATGGHDQTVALWDVKERSKRATFTGLDGSVAALAFSPNGKILISASDDHTLKRWDILAGREVAASREAGMPAFTLALSQASNLVVTGGTHDEGKLFNLATGTMRPLPHAMRGDSGIGAVACTADGRLAASGDLYGAIKVWDAAKAVEQQTLQYGSSIAALVFTPDGRLLVAASQDGTIRVWEPASGKEAREWKGLPGTCYRVAVTPDGRSLIAAGVGGAKLIDLTSGNVARFIPLTETMLAISADGKWLVASDEARTRVWDLATTRAPTILPELKTFRAVAAWPDGTLFTAGGDDQVSAWALSSSGKANKVWEHQFPGPVMALAAAADGRHLLTLNGNGTVYVLRFDVVLRSRLAR